MIAPIFRIEEMPSGLALKQPDGVYRFGFDLGCAAQVVILRSGHVIDDTAATRRLHPDGLPYPNVQLPTRRPS